MIRPTGRGAHHTTPRSQTQIAMAAVTASALSSALLPLGAVGLIGTVAMLCVLVAFVTASPLRQLYVGMVKEHERGERRAARVLALPYGSTEQVTLAELSALVELVEQADGELAERLELQGLLDRHVALTLAHRRAVAAVRMNDRSQLEHIESELRRDDHADPRRLELCERRLRCHEQCEATAEQLATELAIVDDFIRLVAQRVQCPDAPLADDTMEDRLAELDCDDAARRQLAAEIR